MFNSPLIAHHFSMSKENILFSIIGVLLGFIIGFMFANSVNRQGETTRPTQPNVLANGQMPQDGLPIPPQQGANGGSSATGQQPPEIQAIIERARTNQNDFEAQVGAADLFYRIRRYTEAIAFLERANTLRPDNYETIVKLGNANLDAERFEAAERWYNLALTRNPQDVPVRSSLGLTFAIRQPPDTNRAIAEFRRALEIDPRHEPTLQNLTIALTINGDVNGAQATLAQLQSVNPNNSSIPNLRARLEQRVGS
jgi:tetratricopeptide (TPR) repeat protein